MNARVAIVAAAALSIGASGTAEVVFEDDFRTFEPDARWTVNVVQSPAPLAPQVTEAVIVDGRTALRLVTTTTATAQFRGYQTVESFGIRTGRVCLVHRAHEGEGPVDLAIASPQTRRYAAIHLVDIPSFRRRFLGAAANVPGRDPGAASPAEVWDYDTWYVSVVDFAPDEIVVRLLTEADDEIWSHAFDFGTDDLGPTFVIALNQFTIEEPGGHILEAALDRVTLTGPPCPGDVDASGTVDFGDVLLVLAAWGACEACPEDVDGDGFVGFADVLAVLGDWGACPS